MLQDPSSPVRVGEIKCSKSIIKTGLWYSSQAQYTAYQMHTAFAALMLFSSSPTFQCAKDVLSFMSQGDSLGTQWHFLHVTPLLLVNLNIYQIFSLSKFFQKATEVFIFTYLQLHVFIGHFLEQNPFLESSNTHTHKQYYESHHPTSLGITLFPNILTIRCVKMSLSVVEYIGCATCSKSFKCLQVQLFPQVGNAVVIGTNLSCYVQFILLHQTQEYTGEGKCSTKGKCNNYQNNEVV